MEEARQHTAIERRLKVLRLLMMVSWAAFAVAFVGIFFPGALLLKGGLIAFVWIRLALEGARALLIKETGSNLRWQAVNLGVHVVLAGFITYAFAPYFLG